MRIDRLEQRLGKARELCVKLRLHASVKVRDTFQQALDERIGARLFAFAIQRQPARDFWKLVRKLCRRRAEMLQFDIVVIEKPAIPGFKVSAARRAAKGGR